MNRSASRPASFSAASAGAAHYGSSGSARTDTVFDVAVVGQGAVGIAMALAAAQAGCRTVSIAPAAGGGGQRRAQQQTAPASHDDWDARVFALSPSSRELLTTLRIWSALDQSRIAPVYDMRVQAELPGAPARTPSVHFSAYQGQVEALAWIVEGRNLDQTLARALEFAPVQRVGGSLVALGAAQAGATAAMSGASATGSAVGAAMTVDAQQLTLDNGQTLRARLVIGADGAASPVRQLSGLDTHAHDYRHTAVVANFACTLPHQDCAYQWFGAPGVLALLPLPGERCSLVWSAPAALADELMTLVPRALAMRVTDATNGCLGVLESITPARAFPLQRIDVDSLIGERVALVGDAAHVVHPLAGQGMNLGFADVAQWLQLMSAREPFRDVGDALLLRRYQRSRREAIIAMKLATDGLQRLFDPDELARLGPLSGPARQLREFGWRAVAGSDWLRQQLIKAAAF